MARKPTPRADHLRGAIAQEAARLMAEHGIHDFLLAKRKAAERFGVTDGSSLPRNTEIEEALAAHQRLFGGLEHDTHLQHLREVALQAMDLLKSFQPRLVGAVLGGLATEHDDIQLHLFSERSEQVALHLLDRHIPYELVERRLRLMADRPPVMVPGLRFAVDDIGIECLVFPPEGLRQAPVSPVDGRPMRRANREAVAELVGAKSG
ncbi:MAG: hypothetical protein RL026_1837 [Pseudomonadota bacterium]